MQILIEQFFFAIAWLKRLLKYRFKSNRDSVDDFLRAWCQCIPGAQIGASEIYDAYKLWCKDNEIIPYGRTYFSHRLTDLNFPATIGSGGRRQYEGIVLNAKIQCRLKASNNS